jgi:hypothetical protein
MEQTCKRKYDYVAIFHFIVTYKQAHDGNSPALADIMREFGIPSRSVVFHILDCLVTMGLIRKPAPRVKRGLEVIGGKWQWEKIHENAGMRKTV